MIVGAMPAQTGNHVAEQNKRGEQKSANSQPGSEMGGKTDSGERQPGDKSNESGNKYDQRVGPGLFLATFITQAHCNNPFSE